MKKTLVLLFSLLMVCVLTIGAMAETAAVAEGETIEVALVENGTPVTFSDYNFQILLPSEWYVADVSEEMASAGVLVSFMDPENDRTFSVAYNELEGAMDINELAASLADAYENVQLLTINGIACATYYISDNDVMGIVTLGATGIELFNFIFYPASDEDYGTLALQIAASINTIK